MCQSSSSAGCWDFHGELGREPGSSEPAATPAAAAAAAEGGALLEDEVFVAPTEEAPGVKGEGEEEEDKEHDPECAQDVD